MLEDGKGVNCHASNFLRVFGRCKSAIEAGILEAEEGIQYGHNYGEMIQKCHKILLEEIKNETKAEKIAVSEESQGSIVNQLYGISSDRYAIELSYTNCKLENSSFIDVLKSSMKNIKAGRCPPVLNIHCNVRSGDDLMFWRCQKTDLSPFSLNDSSSNIKVGGYTTTEIMFHGR
jgi:hypothetical protein